MPETNVIVALAALLGSVIGAVVSAILTARAEISRRHGRDRRRAVKRCNGLIDIAAPVLNKFIEIDRLDP